MTTLPSGFKEPTPNPSPFIKIPTQIKIPILLYHYVEYVKDPKDTIRQSLDIQPYVFDEQVKTLKEAGFTFMTMADVADVLEGRKQLPEKPVVLTFDDGYRDLYTDVFPIIKKYQVKIVAYVVPGFLGKPNNLTHAQLQELSLSNLVEVAAHTVHHAYLKGLPSAKAKAEIDRSKDMLEKELRKPIVSFAYPYGAFDQETIKLVEQSGFKTAVSTIAGDIITPDDKFFIHRVRPGRKVGIELIDMLMYSKYPQDSITNPVTTD